VSYHTYRPDVGLGLELLRRHGREREKWKKEGGSGVVGVRRGGELVSSARNSSFAAPKVMTLRDESGTGINEQAVLCDKKYVGTKWECA